MWYAEAADKEKENVFKVKAEFNDSPAPKSKTSPTPQHHDITSNIDNNHSSNNNNNNNSSNSNNNNSIPIGASAGSQQSTSSRVLRQAPHFAVIEPEYGYHYTLLGSDEMKNSSPRTLGNSNSSNELFQLELDHPTKSEPRSEQPSLTSISSARQAIIDFLKMSNCYDLMPASGKIVVLDIDLPVKMALQALDENKLKSAPLWDSKTESHIGMITVTDFIRILLHMFENSKKSIIAEIENHRLRTWKEMTAKLEKQFPDVSAISKNQLIHCTPEDSLYYACKLLIQYRIHRLPVLDMDNVVHIVTHYELLLYLYTKLKDNSIFSCSIESIGIGTYKNIATVLQETPLRVVLQLLLERKISAVPVVDFGAVVVDVFTKTTIMMLIRQGFDFDLNRPVGDLLGIREPSQTPREVYSYSKKESLRQVLERLTSKRVYRLVCVDSTKRVEGILSLSDILSYFEVRNG